jgi:hypothetical protein
MRFYLLDTNGDLSKEDYCFSDNEPVPIGSYDLISGARLADEYPAGLDKVTLKLGDDYPGLELPSLIGNTDNMLIVHRDLAAAIRSHEVGEVELLPFTLLNHKGRVHSTEYVFLNPVGTRDCLDMERSECKRHKSGKIMAMLKYVLSRKKLKDAPNLFRPQETPARYIFSGELVDALRKRKFTNLVFEELETA